MELQECIPSKVLGGDRRIWVIICANVNAEKGCLKRINCTLECYGSLALCLSSTKPYCLVSTKAGQGQASIASLEFHEAHFCSHHSTVGCQGSREGLTACLTLLALLYDHVLCVQVVLHITPLRCSRALALRHLAYRFKRPMSSAFTLVTFTAPQVSAL